MIRNRIRPILLGAALLASGCFQAESPRPDAPLAGAETKARPPSHVAERTAVAPGPRVPEPATTLREDPDPDRRREAIYALADADVADRAAVVGQALTDPDAEVREAAVVAMTGIEDGTAADWLSLGLGDPDPRVRRAAVEALGEVGGASAEFLLQQALADADTGVREAAEQMLAEPAFAGPEVRPASP